MSHVRTTRTAGLAFAFAFAVMADPVSSVAYAPQAGLHALHNDLALLLPTMLLVLAILALVRLNYVQLIKRFPGGGGAVAATATAFGEGWAFLPLGSLVVDFVLTIAISVSAASSAIIATVPSLAPHRVPIALGLCTLVAGVTWFGHIGRSVFATMTVLFVAVAVPVLVLGFIHPHVGAAQAANAPTPGFASTWLILLAFPVSMASATGVEGLSSAIAQLGQVGDAERVGFARATTWLTLGIQGVLTMLIAGLALHLSIGAPGADSTLIADLARAAAGRGALFALFQMTSLLLLLAAASSSFQAGPGLMKALAHRRRSDGTEIGILPAGFGHTNKHHTPFWGVLFFFLVAGGTVAAAGGYDQDLVLFYAVAVFISFLAGMLALVRFSRREGNANQVFLNVAGVVVVVFTIAINLRRGYPIASLVAAAAVGAGFAWLWSRRGRPRGIADVEAEAEREPVNRFTTPT